MKFFFVEEIFKIWNKFLSRFRKSKVSVWFWRATFSRSSVPIVISSMRVSSCFFTFSNLLPLRFETWPTSPKHDQLVWKVTNWSETWPTGPKPDRLVRYLTNSSNTWPISPKHGQPVRNLTNLSETCSTGKSNENGPCEQVFGPVIE